MRDPPGRIAALSDWCQLFRSRRGCRQCQHHDSRIIFLCQAAVRLRREREWVKICRRLLLGCRMMLSPPRKADRMTLQTAGTPGGSAVTALSLILHLAALAGLLSLAAKMPAAPADPPAMSFLFSAPGPVAASPRPAPAKLSAQMPAISSAGPHSVVRSASVPALPPRLAYNVHDTRASRARTRPAAAAPGASPSASAPAAPAGRTPPAPVSPQAADDGDLLLRFGNDIQSVVRAAAAMPEAAVLQHRTGRAQVRFAYLDGHVEAVALAQTSRSRLLDDAAVAAVQRAHYPPPPPPLRGRRLPLLVWIDFSVRPASPG